jgi:hydroxymethylbilane synthase
LFINAFSSLNPQFDMSESRQLVIGTRGSKLALTQTNQVRDQLVEICAEAGVSVSVEIIHTTGDREDKSDLSTIGGQGLFTAEIERALIEEQIDVAVHSLKDLPTVSREELIVAATPDRVDVRDVIVTRGVPDPGVVSGLADLPISTSLGTGSPRRRAQLLALRPDLRFGAIRGNIDTRLAKLQRGDFDGIVLAAAGLQRLALSGEINIYLDTAQVLPAPGQGALGLQMRRDDDKVELVQMLNHTPTWYGVAAERSFLRSLGGGCLEPFGAWGRVISGELVLDGVMAQPDGSNLKRSSLTGDPEKAEELGRNLALELQNDSAETAR